MPLKTRILLLTLLTISLLTVVSFISSHFDIIGIVFLVFTLLLTACGLYLYINKQFKIFYNIITKLPDFANKPSNISEIEYLELSIEKLIEESKESPEDIARKNKLIISNEILSYLNDTITEMVDSLGQGFITFDMEGRCGSIYSKKCIDLLGIDPAGKSIFEVLLIPQAELADFNDLIEMIFMPNVQHAVPVDDLLQFFPQKMKLANNSAVRLDYKCIIGTSGYVKKIVLIVTDITSELEAGTRIKKEKNKARSIIKISQRRKDFVIFIKDLKNMLTMLAEPQDKIINTKLKLALHTLKGAAGVFCLLDLVDIIHETEAKLEKLDVNYSEFGKAIESEMNSILSLARLLLGDNFNQAGELRQISGEIIKEFAAKLDNHQGYDKLKSDFMRDFIATPIGDIINGFNSQILDVATDLSKQVAPIKLESNVTSIPIEEYIGMFNCFTHIFNNIVDHGIELPATRKQMGKNPVGHIKMGLFFYRNDNRPNTLLITIEDDGAGVDPEVIRNKLEVTDPAGEWRKETDEEIIQRIFSFGFSTRKEISTLSGRGVGMDAVREEVVKLGGTIRVESRVNVGTKIIIKIG